MKMIKERTNKEEFCSWYTIRMLEKWYMHYNNNQYNRYIP